MVHWWREWQTTPETLPWEPHELYQKAKRCDTKRWAPPGQKVSSLLLGKIGGQLLLALERMNWAGQRGNDTRFWIYLVMKINSDAVKNSIANSGGWWGTGRPGELQSMGWQRVGHDLVIQQQQRLWSLNSGLSLTQNLSKVLYLNLILSFCACFFRDSPLPSVLASGLSLGKDKEGGWREERKKEGGEKRRRRGRGGEARGGHVSPQRCWPPGACPGTAVQLLGARAWRHVYCKLEGGTVLGLNSINSPGPRTAPGLEDGEQKPHEMEKVPGGLGCCISPWVHSSSPGMPRTPTRSTQNAERGQEFFRPEAECFQAVSRRMTWDTKPLWSHISAPAPNLLLLLKMYTIKERTN